MTHLDLFSGIGGFALAADRVFGEVEHTFCEIDAFCQAVLRKHYPKSKIYGDIRELITHAERDRFQETINQRQLEKEGGGELQIKQSRTFTEVDVLTGGFPCQPFSQAGRRRGTQDDRFLWNEMFRVIQLTKPRWVIAENVRGLLTIEQGVVFQQVCADLEGEGYAVQPFIIPAVAVNAPHRRDRVWIVAKDTNAERSTKREQKIKVNIRNKWDIGARNEIGVYRKTFAPHPSNDGCDRNDKKSGVESKLAENKEQSRSGGASRSEGCDWNVADPMCTRRKLGRQTERHSAWNEKGIPRCKNCYSTDTDNKRLERRKRDANESTEHCGGGNEEWNENWLEVATRLCTLDDGLSNGLVRPRGWRNAALKAAGNAIVPAVAEQIMLAIKEAQAPPRPSTPHI